MTEQNDIEFICKFIHKYSPNMLYRDVYYDLVSEFHSTHIWNDKVAILDKWLWKYQYYTVEDFMDLENDPDYEYDSEDSDD